MDSYNTYPTYYILTRARSVLMTGALGDGRSISRSAAMNLLSDRSGGGEGDALERIEATSAGGDGRGFARWRCSRGDVCGIVFCTSRGRWQMDTEPFPS